MVETRIVSATSRTVSRRVARSRPPIPLSGPQSTQHDSLATIVNRRTSLTSRIERELASVEHVRSGGAAPTSGGSAERQRRGRVAAVPVDERLAEEDDRHAPRPPGTARRGCAACGRALPSAMSATPDHRAVEEAGEQADRTRATSRASRGTAEEEREPHVAEAHAARRDDVDRRRRRRTRPRRRAARGRTRQSSSSDASRPAAAGSTMNPSG